MKVPFFIPSITKEDKQNVMKALNGRWLTNGPMLQKFEKKFGSFIQTKYSIGVGSATQGLHLIIRSLGIGKGDEVIVPTFTFAASANSIDYTGASSVLVDVDTKTFNILPNEIKKAITKKTRAIMVVHYGGQSCDMNEIMSIAKKHGLFVIEDCAHALGSTYKNKKCGSIGTAGCFSFYPTKIITTGEGGMVTTNNKNIFNHVQLLKSQGMSILPTVRESKAQWRYDILDLGYNYRLDEIRASLGLSQFSRVNEINKKRIMIAKKYDNAIKKIKGLTIPHVNSNRKHIYHLYTIKIEDEYHLSRDELFHKLHNLGIGTSVQYYPIHLMSYKKNKYNKKLNLFKNSNSLKDKVLSLPIFPSMTKKQIDYVISSLK